MSFWLSPGHDGITYHHLKMMPSTHHFLATLFSKVLLCSRVPPTLWTHAKIIMIHKKSDTTDPPNSVIGKLFHKILANTLERYLILNGIIDKSLQKGFLRGVNGCIEHVFAIQLMIVNAMDHSLLLSLSFIDLKNAFGSVSHTYIVISSKVNKTTPSVYKLPDQPLLIYLCPYIHQRLEDTTLSISKSVFQSDTLSPLLFLVAFNPIIQSVAIHPSRGFPLRLPNHTESNRHPLPCLNSHN